jgi:hypothetical protein
LFEETNHFIPWANTFKDLEKEDIEVVKQSDRTIYKFGKQKILNGLELDLKTMCWSHKNKNVSFAAVTSDLGDATFGETKAREIKKYLVDLFGEPNDKNVDNEDKMSIKWTFDNIRISIVGIEQFAMKYDIRIGWIDEPNNRI